jgi:hypothetical protein
MGRDSQRFQRLHYIPKRRQINKKNVIAQLFSWRIDSEGGLFLPPS